MAAPAKAEVDAATRDALAGLAIGVLRAVAPQVGGLRAMAAAPELMLALGLELPDDV